VNQWRISNSVLINVAAILCAANVAALKDEAGKPIVPNTLETVNAGIVVLAFISCFPDVTAVIAQTRGLTE